LESSMSKSNLRRTAIVLVAVTGLALLPGCLGVAVRGIHETVDPSQPVLRDSVVYFSGGVHATAVLIPVRRGRSGAMAFLLGDDTGSGLPLPGYEDSIPDAHMVLWTVLTNRSGVTAELKIRSETCVLGSSKNQVVSLAPGQRVMLEPLWSARTQNLENLEVELSLELQGVIEENKLMLAEVRKPSE
jgi:hypothetical protein